MNRLDHVAFVTTDAEALRPIWHGSMWRYLAGWSMGPTAANGFDVIDPEGNKIELVQPPAAKGNATAAALTAAPPPRTAAGRLSNHIMHVGFIIHDRAREDGFFREVLGFKPYWFGGMADDKPTWISLQVPDGSDWLEYMVVGTPEGHGIPSDMSAADLVCSITSRWEYRTSKSPIACFGTATGSPGRTIYPRSAATPNGSSISWIRMARGRR